MFKKNLCLLYSLLLASTFHANASVYSGPFLNFLDSGQNNDKWHLSALIVKSIDQKAPQEELFLHFNDKITGIKPSLIDTINGQQFLRYDLNIDRTLHPQQVFYSIGEGCHFSFLVPSQKTDPKILFGSCNKLDKPNTVWQEINKQHNKAPYHLALLAGDQIYNDNAFDIEPVREAFAGDLEQIMVKQPTFALEEAVTNFLLQSFIEHYSKPGFKDFLSTVPTKSLADNHEYFMGKGSYKQVPPVLKTISDIAERFYLLFQHHTTKERAAETGLIGPKNPQGDLISYSYFLTFENVAFYGIDTRTERTPNQVISLATRDFMLEKLQSTKTPNICLITGLPLVYQNLEFMYKLSELSNNSPFLKSLFVKIFDLPEAFSKLGPSADLMDQWSYLGHVDERNKLVKIFSKLAKQGQKIIFLAGDPHSAGAGEVIDQKTGQVYIQQITCSALTTTPISKFLIGLKKVASWFQKPEKYSANLAQSLTTYTNLISGKTTDEVDLNNWLELETKGQTIYPLLRTVDNGKVQPWSIQGWPLLHSNQD